MQQRYQTYFVVAFATLAYCAIALMLAARGYTSASNMELRGHAMMANSGLTTFDTVVSTFPPIPHVLSIAVDRLFPIAGWLGPTTIAAIIAAFLVGAWFAAFRRNGMKVWTALLVAALLALNPLMLRTVYEGAGFVLLHVGLWLTAIGVFGLRRGKHVNDIILVSLGLCFMVFSHPFGIVSVFSFLPFLALVIPPSRLRDAPSSMFVVMLFPLIFAVLSFIYVNWVFAEGPLTFVERISRATASLGPVSESSIARADDFRTWAIVLIGVLAVCPIGVSMFLRTRRLAPLHFSIACLFVSLLASAILAGLYGLLPSSSLVVSLSITIAAACVARWPAEHVHRPEPILIGAGFIGGLVVSMADPTIETARWRSAMLNQEISIPNSEEAQLAKALRGKDSILFDADIAPAVVAQIGTANGILARSTEEFRMAELRGRTSANVIVVRSRGSIFGSDKVGRIFPEGFEQGFAGYETIFEGENWRAYSRGDQPEGGQTR
ncbi:MAG: hypothetical protein ABJP70_06580 [Erythrobacter sp.]